MSRLLVPVIASIWLGACGVVNYGPVSYSPEKLSTLEPGVTTMHQAKLVFGTPTSVMEIPEGGRLLQWQQRKTGAAPGATDSHVAILFDNDGKMVKIVRATRR
jgi:hypothetical protein